MIPLIDLTAQYQQLKAEIDAAVQQVLDSGQYILGPNVQELENEIAAYLGVRHGVGVASGTDALVLGLRALNIGPGDEVIIPAYTFFATVGAVLTIGATPVFVDIDPLTYCLDVNQVSERISSKTRAIIPVHLYGHPADMQPLLELAHAHNVRVIEDNAQAFGASYAGRKTASLGDVGCLSFFPTKNLGGFGDGGMVVTNHDHIAERVRMLRTHGWKKKYHPEELGANSRLDALQAAVLRVKLRYVDKWNNHRQTLALRYADRLSGLEIGLPHELSPARHVYHLYILRLKERERVIQFLGKNGIATGIYYPQPLHLSKPCVALGYGENSFPEAERASHETLAIPFYPEMTDEQLEHIVNCLKMVVS